MGSRDFIGLATSVVVDYFNRENTTNEVALTNADVYVVWYSKSLQNHKALLSTNVPDGMYYEVTYNGDKSELYLDAYKKWKNIAFNIGEKEDVDEG